MYVTSVVVALAAIIAIIAIVAIIFGHQARFDVRLHKFEISVRDVEKRAKENEEDAKPKGKR